MTGEQDQARLIAGRIARRVSENRNSVSLTLPQSAGDVGAELSAMRASLDSLRQKLVQLESRLGNGDIDAFAYSARPITNTSGLSGSYAPVAHPSQERFGVEEATVSELVDFFEGDRKCELEPGGQPCDHCAMCSSRGF